jgi:branched-subunit amino acid aminotransferase/4-amino-4-deoxychorismate lyase
MSSPDYYDGGSVEIGPSPPPNSVISDCQGGSEDSEYVYVKYRIANKRLSSMENEIIEMKAAIDNYAIAIQNETQFRELCQLALLDEQVKRSECRAAYLRLLQFLNSRPQSSDGETTAYKSETEHLLTVIGQLQMKIQDMREQHSGALCVAADHIARTEKALERLQMTWPEDRNPVISE